MEKFKLPFGNHSKTSNRSNDDEEKKKLPKRFDNSEKDPLPTVTMLRPELEPGVERLKKLNQ